MIVRKNRVDAEKIIKMIDTGEQRYVAMDKGDHWWLYKDQPDIVNSSNWGYNGDVDRRFSFLDLTMPQNITDMFAGDKWKSSLMTVEALKTLLKSSLPSELQEEAVEINRIRESVAEGSLLTQVAMDEDEDWYSCTLNMRYSGGEWKGNYPPSRTAPNLIPPALKKDAAPEGSLISGEDFLKAYDEWQEELKKGELEKWGIKAIIKSSPKRDDNRPTPYLSHVYSFSASFCLYNSQVMYDNDTMEQVTKSDPVLTDLPTWLHEIMPKETFVPLDDVQKIIDKYRATQS